MNWIDISINCPKAYHRWLLWTSDKNYSYRDLFDFFDQNNLPITIRVTRERGKSGNCPTEWQPLIHSVYVNETSEIGKAFYSSRKEAESVAFSRAFSFLEDRLNQEETEDES